MDACDCFTTVIDGLRSGDDQAARQLVRRFTGQLIVLARRRLDAALTYKVDPEDLVQSVYKSFFKRLDSGQCEFDTWDSVWGFLALITVRKCLDRAEYHRAACRCLGRERPLTSAAMWSALAREPTPPQAAMLVEMVEQLMTGLDQRGRDVVSLHLQGFTIAEIGDRLGRARRTVRRTIAQAKSRMLRERTSFRGAKGDVKP